MVLLAMVPGRKSPDDRAEMVTEILFGETVDLLDEESGWYQVITHADHYTCWVDKKQLVVLSPAQWKYWSDCDKAPLRALWSHAYVDGNRIAISVGARLPSRELQLSLGPHTVEFPHPATTPPFGWSEALDLFMGTPYRWGGKGVLGIDCSGLTQQVFLLKGVSLPRDAYQQEQMGEPVKNQQDARSWDLAFFGESEKITHVGIITADKNIFHASGQVRIDRFTAEGIWNKEQQELTHTLVSIKRMV